MLGYHIDSRLIDRIKPPGEKELNLDDIVEFNTGITVVLPIAQVIEVFEIPRLKEERVLAVKEHKKKSGYRAASVSSAAKPKSKLQEANDLSGDEILARMLNTPPSPRKGEK